MKKVTFLFLILFINHFTFSQCINNNENPVSTTVSNNSGEIQEIATNIETDQFSTISSIIPSDEYTFINAHSDGAHEYITITDESNNELVKGMSPLTTNVISVAIIRMHISVDSGCNSDLFFHTTTIQNLTKATCNKPAIESLIYKSDTRMDFSWIAPILSSPTGYDWEFVPDGNAQGVGVVSFGSTVAPTTTASTGENALMPNTTYDLRIRSNCGVDGTSDYIGPFSLTTNANPPPVNDFCTGAISIIEETSIADTASATPTAGTLLGGAGSNLLGEQCDGDIGNARDDVWFSFLAQTTDINITFEDSSFDGVLTLFSGDCNSLVMLDCSDDVITVPSTDEEINYSGLVIGQTYYTRVYFFGSSTPANPVFNIKIWSTISTTDIDNDGFGDVVDCDDSNPNINPDTIWYADSDGDIFGDINDSITQCQQPMDYVLDNTDCDDNDINVNPGEVEILNNGIDDDCNSLTIDDIVDFNNLQWPPTGTIATGGVHDVFAQVFENGVTEPDGQGAGIECWIGYNTSNTDPSTGGWTWISAGYNVASEGFTDNNDEYFADIGSGIVADGTYYYASRFRLNGGTFTYGGILADGTNGNFWDGITFISGVLTVSPPLAVDDFNLKSLVVQPNPFNQRISIHIPQGFNNSDFEINLFDLNGRLILKKITSSINGVILIDNLDRLQQGPYFVKISNLNNNKSVMRQLIKY